MGLSPIFIEMTPIPREVRIAIASTQYGLYLLGMAYTHSQRVDEDCAMDNMKVPYYIEDLTETQKAVFIDKTMTYMDAYTIKLSPATLAITNVDKMDDALKESIRILQEHYDHQMSMGIKDGLNKLYGPQTITSLNSPPMTLDEMCNTLTANQLITKKKRINREQQ